MLSQFQVHDAVFALAGAPVWTVGALAGWTDWLIIEHQMSAVFFFPCRIRSHIQYSTEGRSAVCRTKSMCFSGNKVCTVGVKVVLTKFGYNIMMFFVVIEGLMSRMHWTCCLLRMLLTADHKDMCTVYANWHYINVAVGKQFVSYTSRQVWELKTIIKLLFL